MLLSRQSRCCPCRQLQSAAPRAQLLPSHPPPCLSPAAAAAAATQLQRSCLFVLNTLLCIHVCVCVDHRLANCCGCWARACVCVCAFVMCAPAKKPNGVGRSIYRPSIAGCVPLVCAAMCILTVSITSLVPLISCMPKLASELPTTPKVGWCAAPPGLELLSSSPLAASVSLCCNKHGPHMARASTHSVAGTDEAAAAAAAAQQLQSRSRHRC